MTQISIGVVGLGAQAQNHLSVLSRDNRVKLAGVADVISPIAESTAKRYGCNCYRTYQELIDSEKLDAIYVVTPNVFHFETLKYALGKKLNIFCEKPMVIKLDHARDLINSAKSAGILFQVGHNRHFAYVYKRVKELIARGKVKPYMVIMKMVTGELQRPAWGADPNISGGHLYDTTLHMLDMSRWLFGEVKQVSCRAEANVYPHILNDFWINLTHESGLQVPIFTSGHASWIVPFERVEIIGDHSSVITEEMNRVSYTLGLDLPTQVEEFHYLPQTTSWGIEEEDILFVDAIIEKKKPPITVEDGYKAVEIIDACYRSVESKKPISLPL